MKFGVVVFPGSNCDEDIVNVLSNTGNEVVRLWHKEADLKNVDFVVLPGGFSYGDYLRSGAIARFSPIMNEVINFANKGGYVMGICNGFQVLVECQLTPGALLRNVNQKFISENIYLKATTTDSLITNKINTDSPLKIPIAHGEGRFYADKGTIESLYTNNQILFKYCDAAGNITEAANPNGSIDNIAGVCNKNRNVFGMMPHPERAANAILSNTDGLGIFESILNNVMAQ